MNFAKACMFCEVAIPLPPPEDGLLNDMPGESRLLSVCAACEAKTLAGEDPRPAWMQRLSFEMSKLGPDEPRVVWLGEKPCGCIVSETYMANGRKPPRSLLPYGERRTLRWRKTLNSQIGRKVCPAHWSVEDQVVEDLASLPRILHMLGLADEVEDGLKYENDSFLVTPYCWCEREDCPQCGGCRAEIPRDPHGPDCYQSRLKALQMKYGELESYSGGSYWHVPYKHKNERKYDRARTTLCRKMALDPKFGSEVHCTCDADASWRRRFDACECDWHKGRGPFRFGPAVYGPQFWHKPTRSAVRWYKHLGRDTKADLNAPWAEVWADCLASLGTAPRPDHPA